MSLSLLSVQIWIVLCAALNAGGWVLSWFHAFNAAGFSCILVATTIWAVWFCRHQGVDWKGLCGKERRRFRRQSKRALPFLFYLLAIMSLLAALLYRPLHIDAIGYRIPRLFHWAAEGQWHWITSPDVRMNAPAPGGEFLMAPMLFFTKTERFLFFYNWVSFLWLPALVFSVFIRLGVRRRVAWNWMWLLPTGYCYVMQASSLGNDSYGAVYALAAIDFALRARKSGKLQYVLLSMLSIATLTGAKQTNALLGLPWLIAFAPNWKILLRKPRITAAVSILALLASCVPISLMNVKYAGNWKGLSGVHDLVPRSPFWGIIGNCIALPAQNLQPPVFPWINRWNEMMKHFRESEFGKRFQGFEFLGYLARSPSDQVAGIGVVISLILIVSIIAAIAARDAGHSRRIPILTLGIHVGSWLALLVAMAKLGSTQNARYLAPLYPLLIASVIAGRRQEWVVRQRWWQRLCLAGTISTVLVIVTSRQRPLWPAVTVTSFLVRQFPQSAVAAKLRNSFAFVPKIEAAHRFLEREIPKNEQAIGYAADLGILEIPLWKPLWTKRVYRVTRFDTVESLRNKGIRYVVVDASVFRPPRYEMFSRHCENIEKWMEEMPSDVVGELQVPLDPQMPSFSAYVLRLKDGSQARTPPEHGSAQ